MQREAMLIYCHLITHCSLIVTESLALRSHYPSNMLTDTTEMNFDCMDTHFQVFVHKFIYSMH